jgi:hypothetical protein
MQVRNIATSDFDAVHRLLSTSGWAHRIGDVKELGRLVSASQRAVVPEDDTYRLFVPLRFSELPGLQTAL